MGEERARERRSGGERESGQQGGGREWEGTGMEEESGREPAGRRYEEEEEGRLCCRLSRIVGHPDTLTSTPFPSQCVCMFVCGL